MANDLEKCRESMGKAAIKPPKGTIVPDKAKAAAAAAKFAASPSAPTTQAPEFEARATEPKFSESSSSLSSELETSWTPSPAPPAKPIQKIVTPGHASTDPANKAAAAAAGWSSAGTSSNTPKAPYLDPSSQFVTSAVKASVNALENQNANMSSAVLDEPATEKPKIAIDPMMAEGPRLGSKSVSFS